MIEVEEKELFGDVVSPQDTPRIEAREEEVLSSNLTLLMPSRVDVDFMEREESEDKHGNPIIKEYLRRASISTFVPMRVFHKMLAGRSSILKLQQGDVKSPEHTAALMDWMVDMTHEVWKRSEPKMTRDRFEDGLQPDQIVGLFNHFFGGLMQRFSERAAFMQVLQQPK